MPKRLISHLPWFLNVLVQFSDRIVLLSEVLHVLVSAHGVNQNKGAHGHAKNMFNSLKFTF